MRQKRRADMRNRYHVAIMEAFGLTYRISWSYGIRRKHTLRVKTSPLPPPVWSSIGSAEQVGFNYVTFNVDLNDYT